MRNRHFESEKEEYWEKMREADSKSEGDKVREREKERGERNGLQERGYKGEGRRKYKVSEQEIEIDKQGGRQRERGRGVKREYERMRR